MEVAERQAAVIEVVKELSSELNPEHQFPVGMNTHLEWDLGLGSVERHELLIRLEKALAGSLSSQAVFQATTVAELVGAAPGRTESRERARLDLAPGEIPPHPGHLTHLVDALAYQAEYQPQRKTLFLLEDGEEVCRWSYLELQQAAGRIAGGLLSLGVKPEDRVGLMLPSGPDYLAAFYGILWAGAIPVPLYPPFRLDQLEDYVKRQAAILDVAGVRLLISFEKARAVMPLLKSQTSILDKIITVDDLDAEPPEIRHSERALIQFTSGSTGLPKGVVLTHEALLANIRGYGDAMQLTPEDVTISWLPLYHDMGLIGTMLGSIYHGQPLALMGPQDFLARPSRWLWAVHRYGGTISPAPNFAYEICARKIPDEELEGLDLSSWRIALNGAEAIRPETLERFTERFAPYGFSPRAHFPAYGLAEASLAVTFSPPGRGALVETLNREVLEEKGEVAACGPGDSPLSLVACGRPLPHMEVRIVDAEGRPLADRVRGSVEFRGPSSLECYFNNPEATRQTLGDDGWVKTGDLGFLSEGELYLTGRIKDIIIKAGRNIQAEDVEEAVAGVEGVRRGCIAAFGVEDEREGTENLVVVAESRFREEKRREVLARAIEQQVARVIGIPVDKVEVVAPHTVPKTPSGKIRRSECRRRYLDGELEGPRNPALQILRLLVETVRKKFSGLPRSIWCYSWLTGCLMLPQGLATLSPGMAQRLLSPLARLYLKMVGVDLEIRGQLPTSGPAVLVSNHASTLDALVLTAVWPSSVRFLVAPWVSKHPLLKGLVSRLGHLAVHRGDPEAARAQEEQILQVIREGSCLGVFPEGGVEVTPGLRPFALGAFRVAARAGVPVIPIALQGTRNAQPWPRMIPYRVKLTATVGPVLEPDGDSFEAVAALANRARFWIAEHCGDPLSHRRLRRND